MAAVEWLACADEASREDVELAAASLGAGDRLEYVACVDELRLRARRRPGTVWGILGGTVDGLSDINGAAACVADGTLRSVSLVRRGASGSYRSRAARAGVDLVIDPSELSLPACPPRPAVPAAAPSPASSGLLRPAPPSTAFGMGGFEEVEEVEEIEDAGPLSNMPVPAAGLPLGPSAQCAGLQVVQALPAAGEGSARRRVVPAPPEVKGRAPVIVLASGRGGVGKTALAAAFSVAAASWGMGVLALDLDLSCGNLYSCFGLPGGQDLARLVEEGDLSVCGLAACEGVRLVGPCERPELADEAMPYARELIARASAAADIVVVDTSTTFTEATAQAMQLADRLLLVSDGRPGQTASVARASGLAVRLGVARTRIARLENKSDPRSRRPALAGRAEVGLEGARSFFVEDGGAEVVELVAAGQASQMLRLGVPFAESAATVLAQVLTELGALPRCEAARKALEAGESRRKSFFGRKREARSA